MFLHNTLLLDLRQNLSAYLPISYGSKTSAIGHTVHLLILVQSPPKKLLDQVHDAIRLLRKSAPKKLMCSEFAATFCLTTSVTQEDGQS